MNRIQLAGTERVVAIQGDPNLEVLRKKHNDLDEGKIESIGKDNHEIYVDSGQLKALLQPFNVFKTISQGDFDKWDTDFLIEFIIRMHHSFAKKNAVIVYRLAQKVFYRHCENHPELLKLTEVIFLFLHDLLNQIRKEEFYFAYIRQIAGEKRHLQTSGNSGLIVLKHTTKLLQATHEKVFKNLKVIREITDNYRAPFDACHSYKSLFKKLKEFEKDMNLHFYLEKDILFVKAVALAGKNTEQDKYAEVMGF